MFVNIGEMQGEKLVITKNNMTDLNVFFYQIGWKNIFKPTISNIKIETATNVKPAHHIGFVENMGYLNSIKVVTGTMVFEVLEGFPLQSLLFLNNRNATQNGEYSYAMSLEDLKPMDLFIVQNKGEDPYGDLIIKNLKFTETCMQQGVTSPGRFLVANFMASNLIPFKLPFFFNYLISDNYNRHIVRNQSEIADISKDIDMVENEMSKRLKRELDMILRGKTSATEEIDLKESLRNTYDEFKLYYSYGYRNPINVEPMTRIVEFINQFYQYKNRINEEYARKTGELDFLLKVGE